MNCMEATISLEELHDVAKVMRKNKVLGKDGLSAEFFLDL